MELLDVVDVLVLLLLEDDDELLEDELDDSALKVRFCVNSTQGLSSSVSASPFVKSLAAASPYLKVHE